MKSYIWRVTLFFVMAVLPFGTPAYSAEKTQEMVTPQKLMLMRETLKQYPDNPQLGKAIVDYTQAILTHPKLKFNPKSVRALQRAAVAVETGINEQILAKHPDLQQFIAANNNLLFDAFQKYVGIQVDPSDDMPLLMKDGVMTRWEDLRQQIPVDAKGQIIGFVYRDKGFVEEQATVAAGRPGVKKPYQYGLELNDADAAVNQLVEKLPAPDVYANADQQTVGNILTPSPGAPGSTPPMTPTNSEPNWIFINQSPVAPPQSLEVPSSLAPEVLNAANATTSAIGSEAPEWKPEFAVYLAKGIIADTIYAKEDPGTKKVILSNWYGGFYFSGDKFYQTSNRLLAKMLKWQVVDHFDKADEATKILLSTAAEKLGERFKGKDEAQYRELNNLYLAARLAVPLDLLDSHPDFASFVRDNFLFKPLEYFKHKVGIIDNQPALMVNGTEQPWSAVKSVLGDDSKGKMKHHTYTYQGLVDLSNAGLPVFSQKAGDGRFYVQVLHWKPKDDTTFGDLTDATHHVWMRIMDDKGNITSMGFHPDVSLKNLYWFQKGSDRPGHVDSPDYFEYLVASGRVTDATIELSQEQFLKLEAAITNFAIENKVYNIWLLNCVVFVSEALKSIGIHLDPKMYPSAVDEWLRQINAAREDVLSQASKENLSDVNMEKYKYWFPMTGNDTKAQQDQEYCKSKSFVYDLSDPNTLGCRLWEVLTEKLEAVQAQ